MVYYIYELRWASSDNTLKELDESGSFFYCNMCTIILYSNFYTVFFLHMLL